MTYEEAQNVAMRLANFNSDNVTLKEIKEALVVLSNFYEDNKKGGSPQAKEAKPPVAKATVPKGQNK